MEVRKDKAMLPQAISPTAFLPIFSPKKPLMMDPINGKRGTRPVMCVAAAEVSVGLAIIIALHRNKPTVNLDEFNLLKW